MISLILASLAIAVSGMSVYYSYRSRKAVREMQSYGDAVEEAAHYPMLIMPMNHEIDDD